MNRKIRNRRFRLFPSYKGNEVGRIKKLFFSIASISALWVMASAVAQAQVGLSSLHPNLARGSGNDKTAERYEWDSVNLFNGNLHLSIPLGIRYPLAGTFGYQFQLAYNSNVWDFEQTSKNTMSAAPVKGVNAGLGWELSFGRLLPPLSNGLQIGRWVYVSPDGTHHAFYPTLHHDVSEVDPGELTSYTRDGSYYRLKLVGSSVAMVEAPDGTQTQFRLSGGEWQLAQINDRFNNRLTSVVTASPNVWTLSDNHGRVQRVYFKADPSGLYGKVIDRIELAAFNGTVATYTFAYATASVARPAIDSDPSTSPTVTVPLLSSITHPDRSKHTFNYHAGGATIESGGRLASMQLPTMGKVEWDYQTYRYTSGENPTGLAAIYRQTTGVAVRRLVNSGGSVDGAWVYTPGLQPSGTEEREMTMTVKTPMGDKTIYYFSANTMTSGPQWTRSDYALPFTRNQFDQSQSSAANVALATNGATATASSTYNSAHAASGAINGDRRGLNWGSGGGWNDATANAFPDWLEVSFSGSKTIDRINVFSLQDDYSDNPPEPDAEMTFTQFGLQDFSVQYWNGSGWTTVAGGNVVGNENVWRAFTFTPVTTNKIRVVVNRANGWSRVVEVEAFEFAAAANARFLSKQVFDCDEAGNNCQLMRTTYVRYEQDQSADPATAEVVSVNRREVSNRVVYNDDVEEGVARFADMDKSNFDGLGHFRQLSTNGNFGSADVRTYQTNYDAATGNYPSGGYAMPAPASAWILNTVSQQKIVEGQSIQVLDFCYDRNNGFLKRMRRWSANNAASATASANDVVVVYTPDASGQVATEQHYGGDVQPLGTTSLCGLGLPASDQYRIQHTYQYGTKASSQFQTASGTPFGSKVFDQTIDHNTGMASVSRDPTGIFTSYEYDAMGRQTWAKPEAGHGAWKQSTYMVASATDSAKKLVYEKSNGGGAVLTYNADVYDAFGRMWWQQTSVPGSTPNRYTFYNAMGWMTHKSEFSNEAPKYTEYMNHDPFGRPRVVRPPDGAHHDVTYQYAGVRSAVRTASIGLLYYQSSGQVVEGPKSKTQIFDRQGRLWKEVSQSLSGSPDGVRVRVYDVTDQVIRTTNANGDLIGPRLTFDGRGFLITAAYAIGISPFYSNFDARGNALRQLHAQTGLTYTFDRMGRMTQVVDTDNPARVWKEFTYADSNATNDWRAGKVVTAKRYNRMDELGGPIGGVAVVTETFTYGGKGGKLSAYNVALSDGAGLREQFSQSYTYTDLGKVEQIEYPNIVLLSGENVSRTRSVTNTYAGGLPVSVTGTLNSQSQSWASAINYHSHGAVSQVAHSNGVTDNYVSDANGFARLAAVFTTGVQKQSWEPDQNLYSGDFQYDGNQNLVRIGNEFFLPRDGYTLPPPTAPSGYTPRCQVVLTDPFGLPKASAPDSSCFSTVLYYYTASDALFKEEDRIANTRTWSFYDRSGQRLTEYQAGLTTGTWVSLKDYIYRGSTMLAIEEIVKGAAGPKQYHFHLGFGVKGIQTDGAGYRTEITN